jgi:hypothetical protein
MKLKKLVSSLCFSNLTCTAYNVAVGAEQQTQSGEIHRGSQGVCLAYYGRLAFIEGGVLRSRGGVGALRSGG